MPTIHITAASRLHFGLLAPSEGHDRRFGGVGVMIDRPVVKLTLYPAGEFSVDGASGERVRDFARRWANSRGIDQLPSCCIVVESLPRMHAGLGVGTQLGLSVARLLNEFVRSTPVSPADLAASVGRGQRSAVGSYGFFHGGLIAETGKSAEQLAPLAANIMLPESWRWLLVIPHGQQGLHGTEENRVFAKMCDPASDFVQGLSVEVHERLLPAGRQGDFAEFSASLYRFGHRSGLSFAAVQGGAYNGPRLQRIVERIRELGIEGVGQSSWGPTIFALCPHEDSAQSVANQIRPSVSDADVIITTTCNHGACVEPK